MPLRRGMGGLSSGAGGNLFDRPGFFDNSEIVKLTVDTELLLKAASETYGIKITHASTSGNNQDYELEIPALIANAEIVTTNHTQTLTNKTISDLRLPALYDSNGNELFIFTATGSAVNEITLANAATGNPPVLSATGGDTNIGITLTPKGSGVVRITGGLTVDGTTTTLNSTTLSVDDKNIEMGSVASPSDTTADGGGITLKGATDKTIIWDNSNDNWTSNQDWNIASGKSFKINNAATLNATTLGSAVVTSSLTTVGTLGSGAISSGFGAIDVGTSALTAGALTIDNISIDGNTISSSSGNITFNAASSLDFGDDSVLNVGTLTLDAIHGDNNAIQVGDNSDDAVSIYRVNALTAIGDLDIGAHDFRAATITPDGLTSGRVVFAGTNGVLSDDSDLTFATATLTATNIAAFNLTGKLTAGSTEIEGSNFDINGGAIDGVAIGANAVVTSLNVDNISINGNAIQSTDTNGNIAILAHGTGDIHLEADTIRVGDENALAYITTFGTGSLRLSTNNGTNSGIIQLNAGANGEIDILPHGSGDINLTNVDIGSGAIDATTLGASSAVTISGATINGGLTWSAAQNLNNVNLTNVDIDSGTINDITTFGIKQSGTSYEMQIAVGTGTNLTADRVLSIDPQNAARAITLGGDLTLAGNLITSGAYATTLTTTGTTGITLPTSGTLATLAGNETLTNKVLTTPTIGDLTNATHDHSNNAGGGVVPIANTSGTLAIGRGGTGATSLTDGGVLLGSGTSAVTAMAVLADGEMIVGDGTTDPVAESGTTLRTSIGVGTGNSPQFTGIELGHASDTTIVRSGSGDITIEGNVVYRAGGTDVAVVDGGTGASSLNNLITMGTHTTGNYVATITGGTGITSSAATSGESTTHSLSVDVAQGQITSVGTLTSLTTSGDITTTAAVDWDLLDNSASALSFDSAGKAGIINIVTTDGGEKVTMSGGLEVTGNLTVSGTTTTVDSTIMTVVDPIITLQTASGGGALGSDSNKDVGIAMQYHTGSAAKTAFLGFDDTDSKLMYVPDATISSEVVSGSVGTIKANLEGAVTGNADTATEATNVTAVANNTANETVYLTFVDGATGTQGIETDTGLSYNPSTGVVTAGSFAGVVTGTAETALALANPRTIGGTSFDGTANIVPATITVADTTDTTSFVGLFESATGDLAPKTDAGITYNAGTGTLTATAFVGPITGAVTGNVSGSAGSATGNAATATALASGVTIGMTGDVVWTSPSFTGSGNVTAAGTIQTNAVQAAMVHEDVISGRTELTSGVATDADFILLWDATDSSFKKVKPDNLGISGTAAGSATELQYRNSGNFAAAANVQILNAGLALKEMATPNATSGFGMLYAKSDNELYYRNDTDAEVKITLAGAMAGGGAFRGIKAYLTANNTISTGSSTTPTAWTESYDVGTFHDAGSNTDRFTFGIVGYYEIKIQQEWAADAAGYREMAVERVDVSASTHDGVILRDRVDGSSQATGVSGSSTIVYIDDAADYVKVNLYQNSGADLVATGNNDDATAISITRMDMATSLSQADGAAGRVQFSDGSGGFTSDSDLTFSTDTLTATKIGAFEAAGAINFATQAMTNVNIDSGDIASGVTLNGNAATATLATNVNVIANNSTNETTYLGFVDGATGSQSIETDTGLTYNPSSGVLTSTTFTGALSGLATTATLATNVNVIANNSTNETTYLGFVDGATGSQSIETDTGLTYNPSSGIITATQFTGAVVGNVTGNASGTALTVTQAAQSAITSLGTLTTLTVDDITIDGSSISDAGTLTIDTGGNIHLDADDGAVVLLDGGAQFGILAATGSNLVIKSGATTALTFANAVATFASNVNVGGSSLNLTSSTAAGIEILASNSNNAAGAKAVLHLATTHASADPYTRYENSATNWSVGIDSSTSNSFKISNANEVGTTDRFVIDTSGNFTIGGDANISGIVDITDATDSSDASGDTGALRTEGGASIAKKLYVGTDLDVDGTAELDNITIGGAQGSDGQVLTSTGSAVAWEDAGGGQTTYDAVVDAAGGGDYATLQAAEDALDGSSHYTVYVKQGAYSTVAIGQAGGCTWVFEGKCTFSGVINVASGANISLVFGPGCTFADVVSLTATDSSIYFGAGCDLDGQLDMDGAGGSVICENGCDLDDLTIAAEFCTFNGGGWDTVINGTTANHAITITSGGEKALVSNVAVQTTAGGGSAYDGVSCGGGSSVLTRVRVVASDDVGIHVLHPANQARVYDCEIRGTDDAGIKTEKNGVIIQGNWMESISGIGIEMIGDNSLVTGNIVGPTITGDSIDLASGSDNNVVVANRIEGAVDDNGTGNTVASNDSTGF